MAEAHLFMELSPCVCGEPSGALAHRLVEQGGGLVSLYEGFCGRCGTRRSFAFAVDALPPPLGAFGGATPSTLIDAGQFLAVADAAARAVPVKLDGASLAERQRAHATMARAVAALEEVVKFIPAGADRVPPAAFFSPGGAQVQAAEPGRFRRSRLEAVLGVYRESLARLVAAVAPPVVTVPVVRAAAATPVEPARRTVIEAAEAARRDLPPIGFSFDRAGTVLEPGEFPEPGVFVRSSGPPGGILLFEVHPCREAEGDARAVERAMRALLVQPWRQPLETLEDGAVVVAGAPRAACMLMVGEARRRAQWVGVIVGTPAGALLLLAAVGVPAPRQIPLTDVTGHPQLAPVLRTFTVDGLPTRPAVLASPPPVVTIAAAEASEHGLPAIGLRFDHGHLSAGRFPQPGCYVRCSGPPGGALLFEIHATAAVEGDAAAVRWAMRALFVDPRAQPVEDLGAGTVTVAGAARCRCPSARRSPRAWRWRRRPCHCGPRRRSRSSSSCSSAPATPGRR